jgi:hypothetical protein
LHARTAATVLPQPSLSPPGAAVPPLLTSARPPPLTPSARLSLPSFRGMPNGASFGAPRPGRPPPPFSRPP